GSQPGDSVQGGGGPDSRHHNNREDPDGIQQRRPGRGQTDGGLPGRRLAGKRQQGRGGPPAPERQADGRRAEPEDLAAAPDRPGGRRVRRREGFYSGEAEQGRTTG